MRPRSQDLPIITDRTLDELKSIAQVNSIARNSWFLWMISETYCKAFPGCLATSANEAKSTSTPDPVAIPSPIFQVRLVLSPLGNGDMAASPPEVVRTCCATANAGEDNETKREIQYSILSRKIQFIN